MVKKIIAAIFILSAVCAVNASANMYLLRSHKNVDISSPAMPWERHIHAQMAGRYAAMLAKELGYSGKISLSFDNYLPEYTGEDRKFLMSYSKKKWRWNRNGKSRKIRIKMNTISIKDNSDKVDIVEVLKLLEFAIRNRQEIVDRQEEVEFETKYHGIHKTQSLSEALIDSVLQQPLSATVSKVLTSRIYRKDITDEKHDISYYAQNGIFYVYSKERYGNDSFPTQELNHIWTFCPVLYKESSWTSDAVIFDTPNTFKYMRLRPDDGIPTFISQRHSIGCEFNVMKDQCHVRMIGHQLVSIYVEHLTNVAMDKTMLYVIRRDSLIPDLEKTLDLDLTKDVLKGWRRVY